MREIEEYKPSNNYNKYTYARYKYTDSNNKVHYYISRYISTIDIPYHKYELL